MRWLGRRPMRADDAGGRQGSSVEEALRIQRSLVFISTPYLSSQLPSPNLLTLCLRSVHFSLVFVQALF